MEHRTTSGGAGGGGPSGGGPGPSATPRKPGGARPYPRPGSSGSGSGGAGGKVPIGSGHGSAAPPPKLCIPTGNVPGINVDQAGQGGWHQPPASLPALALRPMRPSPTPSSSSRPKLALPSLSPQPPASPAFTPSASSFPSPMPSSRPPLLNAPSSHSFGVGARTGAPALKLSIPGMGGASSGAGGASGGAGYSAFTSMADYPVESADDGDALASSLRTPTPGTASTASHQANLHLNLSNLTIGSGSTSASSLEDMNPTLQARGRDYDGDGESSYGYGRAGNGLTGEDGGDALSAMTEDIRQALSRSRFEPSPCAGSVGLPGNRSRAGSVRSVSSRPGSSAANSRRGSTAGVAPGAGRGREETASVRGVDLPRSASASTVASGDHGETGRGARGRGYEGATGSDGEEGAGQEEVGEAQHSPVFNPDKLVMIKRLGEGTGGSVDLVQDPRTGRIMAKKVISRTSNPSMHKQLLRELEILNSCASPYIVEHYGSFLTDRDSVIGILMEYCEAGSLDNLLQKMKLKGMRCSEHVLGRIASSVLKGLDYLHERRIIHRDIKPSNIVITRQGAIKLCDFGVSGELVESLAGTFTGTSFYMAPERIQNKPYSIKADVWSLGMTLHEIAHLRFPFPPEGENQSVAPIELLSYIVTAPVPVMIDDPAVGRVWSEPMKAFMAQCLVRSGTERLYPWQLLQHPFIVGNETKKVNMAKWVAALCDWPLQ